MTMAIETVMTPEYEVYAVRYASMARNRSANFVFRDEHDGPMPMDFFVWLLKAPDGRHLLVDTGFSQAGAIARNRTLDCCPIDALRLLGVEPDSIGDVILTHLHYDHAGNIDRLPAARFHVQDAEMDYATGRCMCHAPLRHAYAVEDVVQLVRRVYLDRVQFHCGDAQVAPGVELLLIGGHTKGLQAVRVHTARGWVVLASDASHYYDNMTLQNPFPIVYSLADMLDGYRICRNAADSDAHVVPGHDPLVLQRYPRFNSGTPVDIAILHEMPLETT